MFHARNTDNGASLMVAVLDMTTFDNLLPLWYFSNGNVPVSVSIVASLLTTKLNDHDASISERLSPVSTTRVDGPS